MSVSFIPAEEKVQKAKYPISGIPRMVAKIYAYSNYLALLSTKFSSLEK